MPSLQSTKSAIVVVIDRLGAGTLGPYGNSWLDTPHFNRLATQSCLFEFPITDSPQLDLAYRSYWHGLHAMCPPAQSPPTCVAQLLTQAGIETTLLTDDAEVGGFRSADQFAKVLAIPPATTSRTAIEVDETHLAQICSEMIERLRHCQSPFLFWVHACAMQGPWDAPLPLRRQFADEDDPLPPDLVQPPSKRLEHSFDPDEVLGMTHAYAGQICLLDMCIGALLDVVTELSAQQQLLFVLTSPRGYPLGEHHRIGAFDETLYAELLHVPWIMRFPDGALASRRLQSLVQPPDLYATLLGWFGIEPDRKLDVSRNLLSVLHGAQAVTDRACCCHHDQRAIRTPAWFLRNHGQENELFVKPDDRWEANEISDRCPEVLAELLAALDQFHQFRQLPEPPEQTALSDLLLSGLS